MRGFAGRIVAAVSAAAGLIVALPFHAGAVVSTSTVRQIDLTGTVDPLIAQTVTRGIRAAERDAAAAVLVRIDTPGGLSSSMRKIVTEIGSSKVPVVCWVGPAGARAASAGAVILTGCPIAAMAPGTNAGAAHPVGLTGEVLGEKVTNDAAAYMRALAQKWGRNADWAERAVRDSVSATAEEAKKLGAIELLAPNLPSLWRQLDGRPVKTSGGDVTLPDLSTAKIEKVRQTIMEALLHDLVDPNLAFLFFLFGIAGIVFEVLHPGISVPGVLGVLLLVSALVMMGMLPVNLGGLALLAASIVFFIVDLHVPGTGLATAGGIVTLVLGGLFLFDASVPNARVSKVVIISAAIVMALFFVLVVQAATKARRMPVAAGGKPAPGTEGVAVSDLDPQGVVAAGGEHWSAKTSGAPIRAGHRVSILGVDGLMLTVEEKATQPSEGGAR